MGYEGFYDHRLQNEIFISFVNCLNGYKNLLKKKQDILFPGEEALLVNCFVTKTPKSAIKC